MNKYRFQERSSDEKINRMQQEIEDKLATQEAVEERYKKVTTINTSPPKPKDLKDGETVLYFDGTNYYRYYKAGGKLLKTPGLTEVT